MKIDFLSTFLLTSLALSAFSQPPPSNGTQSAQFPPELASVLLPDFNTLGQANDAAAALFSNVIFHVQTPIAVRYALIVAVATYQVRAGCHPVALSFFGKKDNIPPALCEVGPMAATTAYAYYRSVLLEFPQEASAYAQVLVENGLNPFDDSTDLTSPLGWGNVLGSAIANFFAQDGWNSLGDATRTNNRRQFEDSTDYTPVNHADLEPFELIKPLRWQPLTQSIDSRGLFGSQKHVTPHIGLTSTPLVLSKEDFEAREVEGPYKSPNKLKQLTAEDRKKVTGYIDELFEISRNLTPLQIGRAFYWDNKFLSLGTFIGFYANAIGFDSFTVDRLTVGEMLAQYDAVLIAWKEKRRHDLVRPSTMIRRLRNGTRINVLVNAFRGVGNIDASEWEPLVTTQPHSEFPSASATICTASLEHLEVALRDIVGPNGTIPPYQFTFTPLFFPFFNEPIVSTFPNLRAAAKNCGQSRLFAGVHFPPSVPAGNKLGSGIGRAAFEHMSDLVAGRVPKNCVRCQS